MRDNWLKQKIENFKGKDLDSILVIGADADFNSFYKDLKFLKKIIAVVLLIYFYVI